MNQSVGWCFLFALLQLEGINMGRSQPWFKTFGLAMDEDSELDATSNRLFGHLPRRSEPFSMRGSSRLRLPPVLQEYSQQTQPPKRREFSRVQSYSTKPRKTTPAFGLSDLSADSDPNDYHTEVTPKRPSSDISNYPDYLSVANAAFKLNPLPSSKYPVLDTPKYDSKDGKRDPAYDMMQSNDQIVQIIPYVPCRPDGPHSAWRDRPSGVCAASSELGHVCGNIYKMFEVSISESDCGDFDGHWCCYVLKMHRMGRMLEEEDSDVVVPVDLS